MSAITTHVLNTSTGKPAAGIVVDLLFKAESEWEKIGSGVTDSDGRARNILNDSHQLTKGDYKLVFQTDKFSDFFPEITLQFRISQTEQHYHVPLLLSPYGYSTYRGS